jgi:hypothetical protein
MKNFKTIFLLLLLSFTTISFAESKLENVTETVQTVKENSKELKTVYEDTKQVTSTVYDDSKDLLKVLYEDGKIVSSKLEAALISIAEGLKTTSLKAWDILVKQQLVWSWCYLLLTLSSIFLWYRFGKQFIRTQTDLTETKETKDSNTIMLVLIGFLAVADSIASALHFEQMMTGFLNPEFGAIRTLFELAKSL